MKKRIDIDTTSHTNPKFKGNIQVEIEIEDEAMKPSVAVTFCMCFYP